MRNERWKTRWVPVDLVTGLVLDRFETRFVAHWKCHHDIMSKWSFFINYYKEGGDDQL